MYFCKTRDVKSPTRGTPGSAGFDFYIPNDVDGNIIIYPGQSANIPSGIKMAIPAGSAGIFFNKSGVALKGAIVGACVVDSDYRGEVHLHVFNANKDKVLRFEAGQKLVQMLIIPISMLELSELTEQAYKDKAGITERGEGGFGSTGA